MPKDSLILWGRVEDPEDFINKSKGIANGYLVINKKKPQRRKLYSDANIFYIKQIAHIFINVKKKHKQEIS